MAWGMATSEVHNARPRLNAVTMPVFVALVILAAGGIQGCNGQREETAKVAPSSSPSKTEPQIVRQRVPPPKFRIYKFKTDEVISVVVPVSTTNEQLESLLWLFREKVRSHRYRDIGLAHGTAKQWGNVGYSSGMILVYRGEKCANESFVETDGACGYGEHDDAYYQWGIDADQNKDTGSIIANGSNSVVFDYHDGWQAAP